MSMKQEVTNSDFINPLDTVEDVLKSNNWVFNRMSEEELMVKVIGEQSVYRLFFFWHENMNAMQLNCYYEDLVIEKSNMSKIAGTLMTLNENLWIGHFDVPEDTSTPCFRHTCMMGTNQNGADFEVIGDVMDVALSVCEQYFSLFHLLGKHDEANDASLSLALMDTAGEC